MDHYFRSQIIQAAKHLNYYADWGGDRSWVRLAIGMDPQHNILVSLHGLGRPFRGVMAASGCYFRRGRNDEGAVETEEVLVLSREVFQFNYKEAGDSARARFEPWLESVLVKGLEYWRASF